MNGIEKFVGLIDVNAQIDDKIILEYFKFQYNNCDVYNKYVNLLNVDAANVAGVEEIPFLPIEFFKTHRIYSACFEPETVFTSSGTTGETSKHYVADVGIYRKSFTEGFRYFFGDISDYTVLALLPSYLERTGSSLIVMVQEFIRQSKSPHSGFFLHDRERLFETLHDLKERKNKVLLIGVSFALLDFLETYRLDFPELMIMETGGMKGRREEITRNELHTAICSGFGTSRVFSEYGMTELLSQAYSLGYGRFSAPPWLKIIIRDPRNPLKTVSSDTVGGINIIDLANIYSCSFIETGDLGIMHSDNCFEIIGRFDESDIRGCNLMV